MSNPVIIGIAGSLRKGSYNAALLRAAVELAPAGVTIEPASIAGIPLYDGDLEDASGIPAAVADLKDKIAASAGLLLVTPEYNSSIPGVLKNATDWLSRPSSDIARVFRGRAVALTGATPGRLGTALSQAAWLPVLRALGLRPWWGPRLLVGGAAKVFDEAGNLVDERVRSELGAFMAGFVEFAVGSRREGEHA
jgi:chromate reductase, NAD(P)H dehydrogenase (quinone)